MRPYSAENLYFYKLHYIIEAPPEAYFFPKGGTKGDFSISPKINPSKSTYLIKKNWLSIAMRYFFGASPLDIMIAHGASFTSVYKFVWWVLECVKK